MGISPICCRLAFIAIDEVRFPKQEDAELNQQNWMESYPSEAVIIITEVTVCIRTVNLPSHTCKQGYLNFLYSLAKLSVSFWFVGYLSQNEWMCKNKFNRKRDTEEESMFLVITSFCRCHSTFLKWMCCFLLWLWQPEHRPQVGRE